MPQTRGESSPSRPPREKGPDPAPEVFLQTLRRSRLLEGEHLDSVVSTAPEAVRTSSRKLAEYLIEVGELTHYQTEKLLGGRWRGLVVGAYHILAPLGRGGMGTVYLAKSLERPRVPPYPHFPLVALKVLPPKRAREEEKTLLRFRREMELGKHLNHPNITRTLDAGEHNGVHFIAMEFVPGQTLKQFVEKVGPLPVGEAARLFADVAAGLVHAHERGLIHRDLKPSNIMVTPEGGAKILDLGLALLVDEALPEDPAIVGGEGYILGTMDYIAPEQTSDATNVGPRSDLYSLGCSIYYAVCGVPPFPGGSSHQKMKWHRTEAAPPSQMINPDVPAGFSLIIEQCMEKVPEKRPASGEAVRALLLPWSTAARPIESALPHSDREVVAEIDSRSFDPALWDAVPVAELLEPLLEAIPVSQPRRWRSDDDSDEVIEPKDDVRQLLFLALGGCGIVGGIAALAVLMALLRKL